MRKLNTCLKLQNNFLTASIRLINHFITNFSYLDNKKEHWYPGSMVVLRDVDDTNKLKISIWCRHTINFHDMGLRFERRELLLQEMIKILKDLEIEYRMLPLDVNIRSAPTIQSSRMPSTWATTY
jgi:mechanosensitive ion channel protein 4/5/6/7/8/9/10